VEKVLKLLFRIYFYPKKLIDSIL